MLGYTYVIILNTKSINYIYIMNKGLLYIYIYTLYKKHTIYLTNEEVVEDDEEENK